MLGAILFDIDGTLLDTNEAHVDATERFLAIAAARGIKAFPRVPELFAALKERGLRTALVTSSTRRHLDGMLRYTDIALLRLADVLVTKDDAPSSKPAPDLVVAAVQRLEVSPAECAIAAMEAAVDTVVFGLRAPADSGTCRVRPPQSPEAGMPRLVGEVLAAKSRALFKIWLREQPTAEQMPYVEQLLALT